jgi:hypothetical protein
MAIECPRGAKMAACSFSHEPGSTGRRNAQAALTGVNVNNAYVGGELCGVDDAVC